MKKVLFKNLVEDVPSDYKGGKGYPLNRQPLRPMQEVAPVVDLIELSDIQEAINDGTLTDQNGDPIISGGTGTADTIGSHNGASFRYTILTGTPVVTYVTTTADQPVLTVSGGTIKLKELWVPYNGSSGANPIWTINGTVSSNQFLSTPKVFKIIQNDAAPEIAGTYNQLDVDNTPQIRYGDYTSTSMKVQIASVTGTWYLNFLFTMNQ